MTHNQFNAYCASLPHATHVVQWRGCDVWKVGGKVFAIGAQDQGCPAFTFKTSRADYATLTEQPGMRPAPYFASRGMSWVQHHEPGEIKTKHLKQLIVESHRIVSVGLTKKLQKKLGLNQD